MTAARVRLVDPAGFTKISALGVEEQRVNVVLDFAEPLDRVQTLGDGFRVDATIVTHRGTTRSRCRSARFSATATAGRSSWPTADARSSGRSRRPARNGTEALVAAGLKPGERVVVYPSDALRDGAGIEAR